MRENDDGQLLDVVFLSDERGLGEGRDVNELSLVLEELHVNPILPLIVDAHVLGKTGAVSMTRNPRRKFNRLGLKELSIMCRQP